MKDPNQEEINQSGVTIPEEDRISEEKNFAPEETPIKAEEAAVEAQAVGEATETGDVLPEEEAAEVAASPETGFSSEAEPVSASESVSEAAEEENASSTDEFRPVGQYAAVRVYTPETPEGETYERNAGRQTAPEWKTEGEIPFFPEEKRREKKEAKKPGWGGVLALFLAAVILAGAAGFGGACLYMKGHSSESNTKGTVLYQSVMHTVYEGEDGSDTLSKKAVAEIAAPSVVEITTETVSYGSFFGQYTVSGAGSGVILSEDGLIVTNYHVIDGATQISVRVNGEDDYIATVVGGDEEEDLALIRISAENLTPAVLGSSDGLAVGEEVICIGNPLGELGGTVTEGIVSALDREIEIEGQNYNLLQTSAAINPGNSGGGMFNMYGELVGIVNAGITGSDVDGLGFAIPIDHAKSIIEELSTYGYVRGKIDIGMTFVDIQDSSTARMYGVNESGVYIATVTDTSLGFRSGDLIMSVDGEEILTMEDWEAMLEEHSVGDTLSVVVKRYSSFTGYGTETVELTLKEKVPDSVK